MSYGAGHSQNETKAAATADKLGLLGIVFVTGDGRITGPRTPRPAVYSRFVRVLYGFRDTDTVVGRKDLLQTHLFRQVGDVPGSGQRPSWSSSAKASELAVTRPEYDDGLCHFPHAPIDNSPKSKALCGPNQLVLIAKSGGTAQLPDVNHGAALHDIYNACTCA